MLQWLEHAWLEQGFVHCPLQHPHLEAEEAHNEEQPVTWVENSVNWQVEVVLITVFGATNWWQLVVSDSRGAAINK